MTATANTVDLIQSAGLVDRLTGASLDELRVTLGKLEDGARIVRAVIRERQALQRRDAGWKARELATAEQS